MASVNKSILVGYVGAEPTIKDTSTGGKIANFTVATTERWGVGGEKKEKTEWHRCVAFDKTAELCARLLQKGQLVYVEGPLGYNKYKEVLYAQITVRTIQILAQGKGGDASEEDSLTI